MKTTWLNEKTILANSVHMVNRLDSMGMVYMGMACMGMVPNRHPTNRDDAIPIQDHANPILGGANDHPSILGRILP
jgi:hypothetical protein